LEEELVKEKRPRAGMLGAFVFGSGTEKEG
jgi:hypothetical protein